MTGKHDEKTETGICPLCGGKLYPGTTILAFDDELSQVIVVKSIPADVCDQCEETYTTGEILDRVHDLVSKVRGNQTDLSLISYKVA